MPTFDERFQSISVEDSWHAVSASAALPPALQKAFSALDVGTRSVAAALRVTVASLAIARGVARAADLNPAEVAIREGLSEIDTFLAELTLNGGPTIHVLLVPIVRKKALPNTQVLTQSFRDTVVEFLRGDPTQDPAALVADAMNQTAGMAGFMRSFMVSLFDAGDSRRPMFPASFATAGVCLVAGGESYADLVVPARLLASLFDARRARLPLLGHVETVPQNVRVTPIPGTEATTHAVVRWDAVPPINQIPVGRTDILHNEEIVVVCIEGPIQPGESYDWESLFAGVTLPADRAVKPTNAAGNATVIARLRNHGLTQSFTDTRDLDATVPRRYVVYLRERQGDAYFMSPPSAAVWMPRTGSTSTRATRGTPPDWYAVPSVISTVPKLAEAITEVRTQLSRAAMYTTVNTGEGQLVDRAFTALERDLQQRAAEAERVSTLTANLNALASSAAGASVGMHSILITSATGGMAGWTAKLARSLTNPNDPGRPQYSSSAPMTGVVLVAGAPRLPQLASVIALFRLLFGRKKTASEGLPPALPAAASSGPAPKAELHFDDAMRPVSTPQC